MIFKWWKERKAKRAERARLRALEMLRDLYPPADFPSSQEVSPPHWTSPAKTAGFRRNSLDHIKREGTVIKSRLADDAAGHEPHPAVLSGPGRAASEN